MTVCVHSVIDEGENFAGGGDPPDVVAASIRDTMMVGPDRCRAALVGDGLDRGPTDQTAALFGYVTAVDLNVGLVMRRCEPGPAAQVPGAGEATDVADLGHEHCGQDGADPGDGLDGVEAGVGVEGGVDQALEHGDLTVDHLDQVAERFDPDGVRLA